MPISRITDTTPTAATRAAGEVKPRVLSAWQQAVNIAKAPLATTFGLNTFSCRANGKHEIGTDKVKNKQGRLVGEVTVDPGNNTVIVTGFNPATGKPRQIIDPYTALPTKASDTFTEMGGHIVQSGNIKGTFEPAGTVYTGIEPEPAQQVSLSNNVDTLLGGDKNNDRTGLGAMVSTPGGDLAKEAIPPAPKPVPSLLDGIGHTLKSLLFWRD